MKVMRVLVAVVLGFLAGTSVGVNAHGSVYWGVLWPKAPNPTNVHWGFNAEVSGTEKRDSIRFGSNRWDFAGGADFKFTQDLADETGDYPGWNRTDCDPHPANSVHLDNSIPDSQHPSWVGAAQMCDHDGDGRIDSFIIILDKDDWNWNWSSGSPSSNQIDARSVAAHEFGHAWGGLHISDGGSCPNNSTRLTMCPEIIIGTLWARTLETHDSHTIANAYPAP